jgi:hypothetical protein
LAAFLEARVFKGLSLRASVLEARADLCVETACHGQAQALLDGFGRRLPKLRAYLAGFQARFGEADKTVATAYREMAVVLAQIRSGFASLADALTHHGRAFHARMGLGLI